MLSLQRKSKKDFMKVLRQYVKGQYVKGQYVKGSKGKHKHILTKKRRIKFLR
jgi:hypothetical protein